MTDDTAFSILNQRSVGTSKNPIRSWIDNRDTSRRISTQTDVRSLYIHIPFCFHKCHYCDFYSIVDRKDRQEAFADRMIEELRALSQITNQPELSTIFIGGGTPTLLAPTLLKKVLETVQQQFPLSQNLEWTIESNPETLTDEICDVIVGSKINRVSIGAQSFNLKHLKTLERHHNPDSVEESIERAHKASIHRLSTDLIYAIPDQTFEEWDSDLQRALALPIDHISAYALTYEPNTAMTKRLQRGEFTQAPDELEVAMYNHTLDQIRSHGFDRYEVSNHAKPGSSCKHNIAYWRGENWLAAGPSASGHLSGIRWKNTPKLEEYIQTSDDGFAPICEYEAADDRRQLMDRLMMSVRISSGLNQHEVLADAKALDRSNELEAAMHLCVDAGWIEDKDSTWKLTDAGFHFADRVARELIGSLIEE